MPQAEPEVKAVRTLKLCEGIVAALTGARQDEGSAALGYVFGRVLKKARPEVRDLLLEWHREGMKTATVDE